MPKANRTMVRHPLTPSMLSEMGVLDDMPLVSRPFDPGSDRRSTYRVWTCYGYQEASNVNQGTLSLQRSGSGGKAVRLTVEQILRMDPKRTGCEHRLSASVRCRDDALCTPRAWTLTSTFTGGRDGQDVSDMSHEESVEVAGERLLATIGDQVFERPASSRLTADWCLFDAITRLPFDAQPIDFDLLEGLTAWKPRQRLSYRGQLEQNWGADAAELHCFQQLGMGVWPYEFWLDDQRRLVMAITGVRAYILQSEEAGA